MGDGLGPHVGRAGLTLTDHHRRRNGADVLSSTANARARGQIALLQHYTILFEFRHVPCGLSNDDRLPLHLRIGFIRAALVSLSANPGCFDTFLFSSFLLLVLLLLFRQRILL